MPGPRICSTFGPVTAAWFAVIGTLGAAEVARAREILRALNPWHALRFLLAHGGVTYYVAHERILPSGRAAMATWRKRLFTFLAQNAHPATDFFGIPPNATVELGSQLEL
jgi:K+ transporter